MKKFIILFVCFLSITSLISCKTLEKKTYSIDELIAQEISSIENFENFSEETIKTLSIIYRTNLDGQDLKLSTIPNNDLLSIIKKTNMLTLDKKVNLNTYEKNWSEAIDKYQLLEFFKSQNIKVANLSEIKIISDENGNAKKISISSKQFEFQTFANYFNLKSNKNIKITNEKSIIKIEGYGIGFDININIKDIQELSSKGLKYTEILDEITKNI